MTAPVVVFTGATARIGRAAPAFAAQGDSVALLARSGDGRGWRSTPVRPQRRSWWRRSA
jgi:NAD(P)-dependent dehydrogenase (short-subunit alcohol dehydrogenase family)